MDQFRIFSPYQSYLRHGTTQKGEGNFKEGQNDFFISCEINGIKNPITTEQIHTDQILKINKWTNEIKPADALITNQKNVSLVIKTADCQPILIFDPLTKTIAAIHNGWKGSCVNIIGKTIEKLKEEYQVNPADLLVGIGPSLGPCCAEFSDPKKELPSFIHPYINEKIVDFWNLSTDQLIEAGVQPKNIENNRQCTKCQPKKYYSHRNQDSERMGAFIIRLK